MKTFASPLTFALYGLIGSSLSAVEAEPLVNRALQSTSKIIGGESADLDVFDYVAFLQIQGNFTLTTCGGTLISPSVILTTASCLQDDFNDINVILGCNDIAATTCFSELMDSFEIHPDFDSTTLDNDVALIHVENAFSFVDPVAIGDPTNFTVPDGAALTVLGRGVVDVSDTETVDFVRETDVFAVNHDDCETQYSNVKAIRESLEFVDHDVITEQMMCAMNDGQGFCTGDTGGPLVVRCDNTDVQVGVVSFQQGCAFEDIPGVYADVSSTSIFDFINDFVEPFGESITLIGEPFEENCSSVEISDDVGIDYFFDSDFNWVCNGYYFASLDGCDCNCGGDDPDCEFESQGSCPSDDDDGAEISVVMLSLALAVVCCGCSAWNFYQYRLQKAGSEKKEKDLMSPVAAEPAPIEPEVAEVKQAAVEAEEVEVKGVAI